MKPILYVVVLTGLLFAACGGDRVGPVYFDTDIIIWFKNAQGENLLDTTVNGHYVAGDIRLFNLNGAEIVEVYNPRLDAPRDFLIGKNESENQYFMKVFPNKGKGLREETTTTYLQLKEGQVDTITTVISKIGGTTTCDKVWYNGELKYDWNVNKGYSWGNLSITRFITVTH